MKKFFKVWMEADGWGLLVNEGTAEEPRFHVVLKGSERWMERMARELNAVQGSTSREATLKTVLERRG